MDCFILKNNNLKEIFGMKKGIVSSVIAALLGAGIGAGAIGKATFEKADKTQAMSDKHFALFLMMN